MFLTTTWPIASDGDLGSIDPRWLTPCLWFVYTDLPSSSGGLLLTGGVQPQNKITYTEVIGSAAFLMQI
ncbi:hypothetical protein Hlac_1791 [Halorubrum lacusprofundi ATCC 49239]|jgi:hypothetical protein|uniref:Uncharacterized protein n=1 Tax=Halorubrum lacusprofundi (strain ATCC 49239 / DSM 5036 / JCM 8891 / ACAM 34) TaxID=416348 RepID=B9LPT2_HALLT|nr:hypothetical protein Hlac_1791 [Halorubrum lacusprofundi ATCC 49239]